MLDKYISAKIEYRWWQIYIDVYKRDDVISSIEITEDAVRSVLHYWTDLAKTRLEWETMFSHPGTEYALVVKKKDDVF